MRLCGSFWRAAGGGALTGRGRGASRGRGDGTTTGVRDPRCSMYATTSCDAAVAHQTPKPYGVRRTFRDSRPFRARTHRPLADTSDARYAPYASTVHTHMTGIHLLPQRPIHTHTIQPHTHSSRFQHGDSGQLSRPSLTTSHDGGSQVLSSTMVRGGFGCAMHAAAHDVRACVP